MTYDDYETKIVALLLNQMREECQVQVHSQQFGLRRGLKEFGAEGVKACKEELRQMHSRVGFKAVAVAELTRQERIRAQEGLMLLTRKRSGKTKGRLVYNGKKTRN